MTLNRFQFTPVENRVDPTEQLDLSSEEDPRRTDPLYVHPGYDAVLLPEGRQYEHLRTGRRMSPEQYRRETSFLDRKLDTHYYPDEDED